MYRVPVPLPGMIRIAISSKVAYKMLEQQQRFTYLPDPDRLIIDLARLGSQGGVPAILYQRQGKSQPELQIYTNRHYYIVLHLAEQRQDGYSLGYIEPIGLREQERMSKGVLLLQTPYWSRCSELRELQGYNSYWNTISYAWQSLESWRKQARSSGVNSVETGLTATQENYLSQIQMLIDVEHRLEQDKNQFPQPVLYHKVKATGEKRYARDIYTFLLHGSPAINEKNMLRIVEERDLQARVLYNKGNRLTLKFERAIDLDRIPPAGTFEPIVSGAIYRTQKEAIETLYQGESKNPYLLRTLVDRQFLGYTQSTSLPEKELNPAQKEAFQRALTVSDLLLVWGPPGTGKSRTITEIARQYSKQGKRVLITSGTHKAVDNVLEQFLTDQNLMVVRFGHEDRILETVRARLTIDEQTREMKQQILKRTNPLAQKLLFFTQEKKTISHLLEQTNAQLAQWQSATQRLPDLQRLLTYAGQKIETHYQPQIQKCANDLQELEKTRQKQEQKRSRWQTRQQLASQKTSRPVLGFFYRWQTNSYQKRLEQLYPTMIATQRDETAARYAYQSIQQQLQKALNRDPEYSWHASTLTTLQKQGALLLEQANNSAQVLCQQMQGLVQTFGQTITGENLQHYVNYMASTMATLEKRARLLSNWQNELETSAEQLTPEVLRYADIVGATCIGVATAKGLADIDFDLVIVDEAGQISTPNLLVPLVRARRAILVGDHQQLPPFINSNVMDWIKNLPPDALQELGLEDDNFDKDQITSLLTRSAFEQLLNAGIKRDNLVMFTEQRRMPRVVADFASQHFYNQQLSTVRNNKPSTRDSLFQSEFAFVDTSSLSFDQRKDVKREKTEDWDNPGFTNYYEAQLIARLATHYEQNKAEWGIIVPYRAQATLIISLMEKLIESPDFQWNERIATVDSFQGSEKDYIIYSFTRSNNYGSVGFLTELRRFNVALTRARQQLVLVGDLSTLTQANDPDFRTLMQHLQSYVKVHGELLTYQDCRNRLR